MGLLKNLIQLKSQNGKEKKKNSSFEEEKKTYHDDGYSKSKSCQGKPQNLKTNLEAIYHKFENNCKEEDLEQAKLKQPYLTELKGKKTSLLNKLDEKNKLQEKVERFNVVIEELKQDKINVRNNPKDYGIDISRKSSAKFWIGISFLVPLTLYIFIFYVSASYSGFFRIFDPSVNIFGGMFYPKALQEAYNAGVLELGFIIFIPFVFYGLGYLIHMFQHKKSIVNYIKVILLFVVTFVFDAILAYQIDGKLYDLDKVYGSPDFSIPLAFQSSGFWVIIFAGFVSYIIWGLVFDFVMKEHADRDKLQSFINGIDIEITNKQKELNQLKDSIAEVEDVMNTIKVRCSELESIVDGFILPIQNYRALCSEYLQGWQECISATIAMGHDEKRNYLEDCRIIYDEHLKKLDLDTDDYQNKVYRRTL